MHTRRTLIGAAAGTITAVATAGCSGVLGEGAEESPADADGVRLDELSIQNTHDVAHQVQMAVEADGEMLHLGTYDLDDDSSRTVEGSWTDTPGFYRIHVTLDGGEVQTADVVESIGAGASCARVLVRIGTDGELAVWTGANCGADAEESDLESV